MKVAHSFLRWLHGSEAAPAPPAAALRGLDVALHAPPPTGEALRALLRTGPAFPPRLDQRLRHVFGMPVHESGLRALYARLLPGLEWHVWPRMPVAPNEFQSYAPTDADTVAYDVEAWHSGTRYVQFTRQAHREPHTGAIDLATWDLWVHPSLRGLALTARSEALEAARLLEGSSHPDTRLTLAAGQNYQEWRGSWVHAQHGYRFARGEDRAQMRRAFSLALVPHVMQRPAEETQALVAKLEACAEPFDFAQLDLGVTVGAIPLSRKVMTEPQACWFGQRHVRAATEDPVENQARQRALGVFHTSLTQQTRRAALRLAQVETQANPRAARRPAPARAQHPLAALASRRMGATLALHGAGG